jgi:DNA-directed RNA polymerase specialized sigma24 family protein
VLSDAALVERVIQRDSTALIELERRHRGSLYAQAYAALADATLAESIVRDAFTEFWLAAPRFVGQRSATTWLRSMTRELVRAELALREPQYATFVRRTDEANPHSPASAPRAESARRADTGTEPPCIGNSERESGGSDGTPRDASAW